MFTLSSESRNSNYAKVVVATKAEEAWKKLARHMNKSVKEVRRIWRRDTRRDIVQIQVNGPTTIIE